MAFCSPITDAEFQKSFPDLYKEVCNDLGTDFIPVLFRTLVKLRPELAHASWQMVKANLIAGNLPRITKELIFSYIAYKQQCDYCHVAHHALAIQHGFTDRGLAAAFSDIDRINKPTLQATIRYAEHCMQNNHQGIVASQQTMKKLKFSDDGIAETAGIISCALYMVNLANSMHLDADQPFKAIIADHS